MTPFTEGMPSFPWTLEDGMSTEMGLRWPSGVGPLEKGPGMTTGAARGEPRGTTFVRVGGDGVTVGHRQELMRNLAPQGAGAAEDQRQPSLQHGDRDLPVTAYAHPGSAGAALVLRVDGRS